MGLPHENAIMCDSKGTIYKGRPNVDQWRSAQAVETPLRTLEEACEGADVLIGLSVAGAVSKKMIKSMAKNPIIFVMANPDPEISPEDIRSVRDDAIIATGRSDYPNQVNNVLGFPYIFRGALDARARTINDEMKVACANALAMLARKDVPDEVAAAYGKQLRYGPGYIIPTPFDPRLISEIPPAVAKAAQDTGVARKPISDMKAYREKLAARLDPSASFLQQVYSGIKSGDNPRRIVFAEGENLSVIRAAYSFQQQGFGKPILIGREDEVKRGLKEVGLPEDTNLEIHNARLSTHNLAYTDYLYKRLQRQGYLHRDVQRMVNTDRNVFGACMLALGHADGMVTGVTRNFDVALNNVRLALDPRQGERLVGMSIILAKGRTLFMADTNISELPSSSDLAEIAMQAAHAVRSLGTEPRAAFVSYSNFGNPETEHSQRVAGAVRILDERNDVDFNYEGEMTPRMALNERYRAAFPFSRLQGEANLLVVPGLHSGSISTKLLGEIGEATVIGPLLIGLEKSVQIAQIGARVPDIVTLAVMAAAQLDHTHRDWVKKTV